MLTWQGSVQWPGHFPQQTLESSLERQHGWFADNVVDYSASTLLCKGMLQASFCHHSHTNATLLLTQLCKVSRLMESTIAWKKRIIFLVHAALQTTLQAPLCQSQPFSSAFLQVCRNLPLMHSRTAWKRRTSFLLAGHTVHSLLLSAAVHTSCLLSCYG